MTRSDSSAPKPAMSRDALRGHLAMLLFSALVAGSFSFGVMAAPHIAPTAMNAARFAIAAVIVGAAAMATGGIPRSALRAPWRYAVLGGIFGSYFVLMFEGLKTASPVSAAAVFTLTPLMAAGFGAVMLRQYLTRRIALALCIGGAGAIWVIFRGDLGALLRLEVGRGEAVYFVGCVAHAVYTPLVRLLNRGERPVVFTFGTLAAGAILITFYGRTAIAETDWGNLPAIVWFTLAYIAVIASATTFTLLQYAALRLPSAKVMAYTYLTPSWVILLEAALGHGVPPAIVVVGVVMTVAALAMLLKEE